MKKKSTRDIPDFSRQAPRSTRTAHDGAPAAPGKQAPQPRAPQPTVKPQATSSKAGRRGS